MSQKKLIILGTRGVPAQHGGFETFAEKLSVYLVAQGWEVVVYCQEDVAGPVFESAWEGVKRVHIPVAREGSAGSVIFDWHAAWHASKQSGLILTLGYNTAIFNVIQRIKGQVNVINMDGIEWKRDKWSGVAKAWFWLNERIGCYVGNHLVADHPAIKAHLATRVSEAKITTIPYGGDEVTTADASKLEKFGLQPGQFSVIIARPEPENSFLEMVTAFATKPRDHKLVVLGKFDAANNAYHRAVIAAGGPDVLFPGAIYDKAVVGALRFFSRFYLHGHTVGGTNPSLVEAMGAGCAVMAHDNQFNRWVAGESAAYFKNQYECEALFDELLIDDKKLGVMREGSRLRFQEYFTWERILGEYKKLLSQFER
ncbi:MAG: DUF1972 domain-containing protein [Herminiimonas sp.]|uniref:DUF1972 domain-containing protein n=1 Tax=Herminiimonas sp. TaxID=1926289 RepID=UPI002728BBE8|nr:DUF1972 domain-containing protein [Herminiimonas sp.]MDO9419020.1 DUF1972 domain-containing protein [Herminiimonas sp.]